MRKYIFSFVLFISCLFGSFAQDPIISRIYPVNDTTIACYSDKVFFSYDVINANRADSVVFVYSDRSGNFSNGTEKTFIFPNSGFSNPLRDTISFVIPGNNYKIYAKVFRNGVSVNSSDTLKIRAKVDTSISPNSPVTICSGGSVNLQFNLCSIDFFQGLKIDVIDKSNNAILSTFSLSTLSTLLQKNHTFPNSGTYFAKAYFQYNGVWYLIGNTEDVVVQAPPALNFSLTQNQNCSPSRVTLNITNYSSSNSYEVNDGSGWVSIPGSSFNKVYDFIGSGTTIRNFQVRVTNGPCSITSPAQSINISQRLNGDLILLEDPDPSSGIDWVSTTFQDSLLWKNCKNSNQAIIVYDTGSYPTGTSFRILWGDGSVSSYAFPPNQTSHQYTISGYFYITYQIINSNNCTTSVSYKCYKGSNPGGGITLNGNTVGECAPKTYSFNIVDGANVGGTWASNPLGTQYLATFNDGTGSVTFMQPPPSSFSHLLCF
jgi:hypothetical protein